MNYLNVFLTNLEKYNESELVGEWLHLPLDEEEIEEAMKRIGIDITDKSGLHYAEYFIADYDSFIGYHNYGENSNIYTINKDIQDIANCVKTEDELEIFNAIRDAVGSLDEAIILMQEGYYRVYPNCKTMEEVAQQIVEETGLLEGVSIKVSSCFDYEIYASDLEIERFFVEMKPNTYLEVYYGMD